MSSLLILVLFNRRLSGQGHACSGPSVCLQLSASKDQRNTKHGLSITAPLSPGVALERPTERRATPLSLLVMGVVRLGLK